MAASSQTSDLYADLRKHAGSNHPQKGRLNVVLAAVEEIICERNGVSLTPNTMDDNTNVVLPNISPSDYFAAFMTALEGGDMSNMEDILALMVIIIQYVPTSPLRAKFKLISSIFLNIGQQLITQEHDQESEQGSKTSMLKNLLTIFAHVIKVQECTHSAWQSPACLKSFDYLLSFIDDKRPKIRKTVHLSIFQIMSTHYNHNPSSLVLVKVSDLCMAVINKTKSTSSSDASISNATIIHYLSFMNDIAYMIPEEKALGLGSLLFSLSSSSGGGGGGGGSNSMLLSSADKVLISLVPKLSHKMISHMLLTMLTNIPSSSLSSSSNNRQGYDKISNFNDIISACLIKLYDLNKKESYEKLPKVLKILTNYCEVSSKEIVTNSVKALDLIFTKFIKLDFFDHKSNSQDENQIVLQVLSSFTCFLEYKYQQQWTLVFPLLGDVFKRLSKEMSELSSSTDSNTASGSVDGCIKLLLPLLKGLVSLHDTLELTPEAAPIGCLESIEAVTCDAAVMFGPQVFLSNIPLNTTGNEVISNNRLWCLKTLRQSIKQAATSDTHITSSPSLNHFQTVILPLINHYEKEIKLLSNDTNGGNNKMLIKTNSNKMIQLWGLFPAYCIQPYDMATVLPLLLPSLTKSLKNNETQMIICHSLKTLVSGDINSITTNTLDFTNDNGTNVKGSLISNMRDFKPEEKEVMSQVSKKVLPILFKLLDEGNVSESNILSILETTTSLSNCAQPSFVNVLFKTLLSKLLQATLEMNNEQGNKTSSSSSSANRVVIFCDLAISLVPVLDDAAISLLYNAIKPMVSMDENAQFQKRCYRILHLLCDYHPHFTLENNERIEEILTLLTQSLLTCHVSSRTMRLRCLISITNKFNSENEKQMEEYIPNMLGEVMLCTKDSNGKARESAYELLTTMCTSMKNNVKFISIVLAGLGARTPHMKSAAVMSLSHTLYFAAPNDPELLQFIPELLSTVLVLLHENSKEIIKSVISFIRIAIALCPTDILQPIVPNLITGIMKWAKESKNKFRSKVKLIMKKLCRLYTFEEVSKLIPDDDQPLISYLQRMANRSSRKRKENQSNEYATGTSGKKSIDEMLDEEESEEEDENQYENDEESDSDEEEEFNNNAMFSGAGGGGGERSKKRRPDSEFLMQDHDDEGGVVDLLDDSQFMKHVKIKNNDYDVDLQQRAESQQGPSLDFASDGRMIIPKEKRSNHTASASQVSEGSKRKRDSSSMEESVTTMPTSGVTRKKQVPKNKSKHSGKEYKAKKGAGGDVKKQGELEPYAYIPLDGKTLTNKKKKVAVEQYSQVLFKSGSAKGAKAIQGKNKKGTRRN